MTRQKTYEPIGAGGAMYGWTGMDPSEFAERMKKASVRFRALKKEHRFDAIAFCGSSGCAIAFYLAAKHRIPLMYVRKANEKCHSDSKVECNDKHVQVKKYLIVDDFPDTGATVNHIIDSIRTYANKACAYPAKPIGVLCFDTYVDRDQRMDTEHDGYLTLFSVDKVV